MKRLLLLGGGHAHVHVLQALARRPLVETAITLVTPHPRQLYSGMVPGLVAGHYAIDQCVIPLAPLAARAGVQLLLGSACGIDAAARSVTLADGQRLPFGVLSIDTGPVMDRDAIAGAREHALFVRPIEDFSQAWEGFLARARAADEPAGRARVARVAEPMRVVVVGGGAAGVELALAMQHRLQQRARITLLTGGPPVLQGHADAVQRRVRCALQRSRVQVVEDSCSRIDADHLQTSSGERIGCDAAVLAIGASAPGWLRGSGLQLDPRGFIATGPTLQSVSHPDVFAAGDVSARSDVSLAKSGVYAVRAGPPLAANLRRHIEGRPLRAFQPQRRTLNLLACGERYAIASWGGWSVEGRWVWRWKDRIDQGFIARFR